MTKLDIENYFKHILRYVKSKKKNFSAFLFPSNNIRIKGMYAYSHVLIEKLPLKKDGLPIPNLICKYSLMRNEVFAEIIELKMT